jgi:hypothetical protein
MSKSLYTEEKAKKVIELRKQGLLWSEIAKKMKISDKAAQNWAVKFGASLSDPKMITSRSRKGKGKDRSGNGVSNAVAVSVPSVSMATELSKKERIQQWLEQNPGGSAEDFVRATKTQVHPTYFNAVKRGRGRKGSTPKRTRGKGKKTSFSGAVKLTLKKLEEENAYLRWCNTGERRGWVDRLLKEIQE